MTSDNSNKKECEGCVTNKFCMIEPSYINPETDETIKCPCTNCIVKAICEGGYLICKEYLEYVGSIRRYEATTCKVWFEKGI